jgi:hypothetical protein
MYQDTKMCPDTSVLGQVIVVGGSNYIFVPKSKYRTGKLTMQAKFRLCLSSMEQMDITDSNHNYELFRLDVQSNSTTYKYPQQYLTLSVFYRTPSIYRYFHAIDE